MKKIFVIFVALSMNNAFALYNENIPNSCEVQDVRFYAFYQPNSYTCAAGFFLPASTDGCRPCPSGYTCPGGTFNANINYAQGLIWSNILANNATKACSLNFPETLMAIYAPAPVVTINWDNNGDINSTTCNYGDTFDLPPNPTRVGYVFTGWKVKNNNE